MILNGEISQLTEKSKLLIFFNISVHIFYTPQKNARFVEMST
jgi:hypothetical protein